MLAVLQAGNLVAAANHENIEPLGNRSVRAGDSNFERMLVRHRQAPSTAEVLDLVQSGSLGKIASMTVLGEIPDPAAASAGILSRSAVEFIEIPASPSPEQAAASFLTPADGRSQNPVMGGTNRRPTTRFHEAYQALGIPHAKLMTGNLKVAPSSGTPNQPEGHALASLAAIPNPAIAFGVLVGISTLLVRRRIS